METKANYVAVGLFTLLLTLAGFGFVYWTSGVGARGEIVELRVRIPGSAAGLGRGSAVLFNGVKVGDVRRVYIDVTSPTLAIAETQIDRLTPITSSTRADIGLAGLTGQANIELKGGDPSEASLIDLAEAQGKVAEITANPSAVTNLLQTAQDIFARADAVLSTLEGFAGDVRGPLTETATHINTFAAALGRNADGIDTFLSNFTQLSEALGAASGRLDSTLAAAEDLINAVDREKVGTIVSRVETFTTRLESASADFEGIMKNVDEAVASVRDLSAGAGQTLAKVDGLVDGVKAGIDTTVASIGEVAGNASGTLAKVDGLIDGARAGVDAGVASIGEVAANASGTLARVDTILESVKPERVEGALANIEGATQDARSAAADVAALAARFGERTDDIDRIITDTRGIAEKLNLASTRVDGVLAKVDGLIDGARAGVDASVASIGEVAANVSGTLARADTILESVKPERVESALANIEGATQDARSAAADVAALAARFGERADDIDRIITDTRGIAEKLNLASTRVDGVLAKVDSLLGSGEAEGVMAEANETLRAFRQVADTLNARMGTITDGLARFSGQGLREVESLVRDSRRSINRIEQAITSFERNPQRILSGGEGNVREYDGRTRR